MDKAGREEDTGNENKSYFLRKRKEYFHYVDFFTKKKKKKNLEWKESFFI